MLAGTGACLAVVMLGDSVAGFIERVVGMGDRIPDQPSTLSRPATGQSVTKNATGTQRATSGP